MTRIPPPAGAEENSWKLWARHRAASKPVLWPNHRAAVATNFLDVGKSAVLVLPTGAGKTTLSELKIASTLSAGKKVIFLVPTLALVDQLRDDLAESFPESLIDSVVSADGDLTALIRGPELESIEVMTPKRCLALLSFTETDMSDLGLLVFDECHLLSPSGGGSRSVDAMLCLLHAIKRAPNADLLLLSAMLKNAGEVADWLATITERPCIGFHDPWKPSRQARGVVIYPEAQVDAARVIVRRKKRLKKAYKAPPLNADPYALFGLHHAWSKTVATDTRLVRLSDAPVELGHGTGGATPNANDVGAALAKNAAGAGLKTIMFVQQADHAPSTTKRLKGNRTWARANQLRLEHLDMGDAERLGDLIDGDDGGVALAAFQIAEILLCQAGAVGQLLLREATFSADPGAIVANEFPHVHARNHWRSAAWRFICYSMYNDMPLLQSEDGADPPVISRSASVARTAGKAAAILVEQDARFVLPSRKERDALLVGFAKRRRTLYGAAYDVVRLDKPIDLSDPDFIAAEIDSIRIYEIKATNQPKIGPDLKGYFFNITSAELLIAQALGDQYRFAFVNIVTGTWQEMGISALLGRARAIYPAFHIRL